MSSIKRERNVDFTSEETDLLLKLVNTFKHILENEESDAAPWQLKETCWRSIELSFNSARYRSVKSLKMKYEAYKRDMKKNFLNIQPVVSKKEVNTMSDPLLPLSEANANNLTIYSSHSMDDSLDSYYALHTGERDVSDSESQNNKSERITENVSSSEHPDISLFNHKCTSEMLTRCKLEVAKIQKELLHEELKNKKRQWLFEKQERVQKKKQWNFEEEEREHKRQMWALEKQILLKKFNVE